MNKGEFPTNEPRICLPRYENTQKKTERKDHKNLTRTIALTLRLHAGISRNTQIRTVKEYMKKKCNVQAHAFIVASVIQFA